MSKKSIYIIIVVLILVFFILRLLSPEDTWICLKGEWVKHGNPSFEKPMTPCQ